MINSIEPAIDPSNIPTFLLDWELTLKCNLDCSYCRSGPEGCHWNEAKHPDIDACLSSIDFMFAYVDRYMAVKPKWQRAVVLNVYGGESIFHPDIVQILEQVKIKYRAYAEHWPLTVACTTNAVAGPTLWQRVSNLIDEFTVSFHSETLPKQRQQIFDNILYNKASGRKQTVIFVMHNDPVKWQISVDAIEFCKHHGIKYVVKANDRPEEVWSYSTEQFDYLSGFYKSRTAKTVIPIQDASKVQMSSLGRSCCGGRKLCTNQDLKSPQAFVAHTDFTDWYCSVNWYFLFVKQHTGDVYVNKDCQMKFDGSVGPIGNITDYQKILDEQKKMLDQEQVPVIQCKKQRCICGYCAPKAKQFNDFENIMKKHVDKKVKFAYNNSLLDK